MQILARSVKFNNSEGEFERSRTVNIYKNNPQIKKTTTKKKKKQKKQQKTKQKNKLCFIHFLGLPFQN